ncbi:MAG: FAD:protein FMN transferase [Solirubrobacteraceae bacterium]
MSGPTCTAQFEALGTSATVVVTQAECLSPAREAVEQTIGDFDMACSRFRDDSELSAVNAAAGSAIEVSTLLLDAVEEALRAAQVTDGDVDPTVGQALIALGYDRDFAAVSAREGGSRPDGPAAGVRLAPVPGWRSVTVDRDASTVRVGRGVRLDLGATAKALASDRAVARAAQAAGCGVLVSLGGDIAVAGEAPPDGWPVRVTDDHRAEISAPGQSITMRSGGLATSSTTVRRWSGAHHVLDPGTGSPAAVIWRTVSVAAATCLDANIASTASIVRGEAAVDWLRDMGLPARLVRGDGAVIHVAGWPEDGEELAS